MEFKFYKKGILVIVLVLVSYYNDFSIVFYLIEYFFILKGFGKFLWADGSRFEGNFYKNNING